jgi:Cellulase (glycosyl hydrolase family 5)
MARRQSLLVGLALALTLSATVWLVAAYSARAAPASHAATVAPLGGVNISGLYPGATPAEASREIAQAKALHAKIVRVAVPWSVMEPTSAGEVSPQALFFTDRLVNAASAARIRVIMTVDSTPCWATSAPASLLRGCVGTQDNPANAWPPVDPAQYAAFTAYLAKRYGTNLAAIEIWNEPDQSNQLYFAGPNKVQRYAAILRAAYPAIKAANPQVTVIGGSLVGSNGVFLRELYAAGIKGFYDGLAVHFYNLVLGSVRSIHEVQLANGDTKPLWLDEFGWSSCYPKHKLQEEQACVTPHVQAINVTEVFRALAHTSYVAAVAIYNLQDSGSEKFGVLSSSGARKPSFAKLAQVLASPFGSIPRVTLSLRKHAGRTVASGSGPVGDFMELEAFQGSVLRYRALFVLDRFNRYSIALPGALDSHGLRVRVYQYWAGVGKAAQRSN